MFDCVHTKIQMITNTIPTIRVTVFFQFDDIIKKLIQHCLRSSSSLICYQGYPICGLLFGRIMIDSDPNITITSFLPLFLENHSNNIDYILQVFREASNMQSQTSKSLYFKELLIGIALLGEEYKEEYQSLSIQDISRLIDSCNSSCDHADNIKQLFYYFVLTQNGFPYELRMTNIKDSIRDIICGYEIEYSDTEMSFLARLEYEALLGILASRVLTLNNKRKLLKSLIIRDSECSESIMLNNTSSLIDLFKETESCLDLLSSFVQRASINK